MRYKEYQPEQVMMLPFDSSVKFPEGTWERLLVNTLGEIDTSSFYPEDNKHKGGEAPYNPRSLLGIILYGMTKDICSLRKLEYQWRHNDAFMFVGGFCQPDHSSIGNFINRHPQAISDVFTNIVYIAHKAGMIKYKTCSYDGTKIKANASKEFIGTVDDFKKKEKRISKKINKLIEEIKETEKTEQKEMLETKAKKLQKKKEKISEFLSEVKRDNSKKGGEERWQNITDNDSRLMKDSDKGYIQGYNARTTVEDKNQFIVAAKVVSDENDKKMLEPMYKEKRKKLEKNEIKIDKKEEKNAF